MLNTVPSKQSLHVLDELSQYLGAGQETHCLPLSCGISRGHWHWLVKVLNVANSEQGFTVCVALT